jgi:hypothetical protein
MASPRTPGELGLFELTLEALEIVAKFGDAAGHGEFVNEEDSPDSDPGRKQKVEISHDNSFAASEFAR